MMEKAETVKILAIGNSFSQDATRYLKAIADSGDRNIHVVNLYIGGCSLEIHAKNARENNPDYVYEENGIPTQRMISIPEALAEEPWDYITIQQASHFSGMPETYEPWGSELLQIIHSAAPQARVFFHMTWAYAMDSTHPAFPNYHNSQAEMITRIRTAAGAFCRNHQLPMIPSGEVIQTLRQLPEFDESRGGEALCRDGFHMSWEYGRYSVAAAWYEFILGENILQTSFQPENTRTEYIGQIRQCIHQLHEKAEE